MGVVYEAVHGELGRRVALKTLRDDFARDHVHALERFRQEAVATASLNHPHIVQVTDFAIGPPTYLVMEMLSGESLRARLARPERLSPREACTIVVQILSALRAAHAAGIVHRDIKPENVFLVATAATPAYVKVLDFGIAKLLDQQGPPLTRSDEILGSLGYMPPEQIGAGEITERTDVYSVGVVLYELLAGRKPYEAESPAALVATILRGPKPAPIAGISAPLMTVVTRAMATLASERFGSAGEMLSAIESTVTSTSGDSRVTVPHRGDPVEPGHGPYPNVSTHTARLPAASAPGAGTAVLPPPTEPSGPSTVPSPSPRLAPHTEKLRQTFPPPEAELATEKLGPAGPPQVALAVEAPGPLPVTLPSVLSPHDLEARTPPNAEQPPPGGSLTPESLATVAMSSAPATPERSSRAGAGASRFRARDVAPSPPRLGLLRILLLLGLLLALGSAVAYATAMYVRHHAG